ncbi:NAD(P)/FAD-dependent oxidoreductase [Candidatus Woesearchaeota archaeon]|nr:NAD(P)/FAD-dependent oxidoreductase [Candidatus Woesearchaeota archaeon]
MVNIMGAGPVGSYAAYLLARKGFEVNVYEEHDKIGEPVQCTGITTKELQKIVDVKEVLVNATKSVVVHSPNDEVELKVENLILDRAGFDRKISEMAESEGARYHLLHKYIGNNLVLGRKTNSQSKISGAIIGADGPLSRVAESFSSNPRGKFLYGVQGAVKRKSDADVFEVWLGNIAPGFFAWSVPESSRISRIGLASLKSSGLHFQNLLSTLHVSKKDILGMQGGLIPIYNPKIQTKKKNTYLVGDAAAQVKATTGGGIVPGMIAARSLARDIEGKCDYERDWRKKIGRELRMHLLMRNMLNRFSDRDYDDLMGMVKSERVKSIIEHHDREFPVNLAIKLLLNEPRLVKFGKFLF